MSDPTRNAAFDLLTAVLERRQSLEGALEALSGIDPRDRAAGHRLAACVLRRAGTLDAALEPLLKKAPPPAVRRILLIGAAGLLLLDTPAHAAVATAVALARSRGLVPFAGLVNAVLRRLSEAGPAALDGLDSPRLDTPAWLWTAWGRDARAIAVAQQTEAPLDLTLAPGATPPPGGIALPTGTWRYPAGTRVTELDGYEHGAFWVQDAAAALPAHLLGVRKGEKVADLCAAPGGKTAQLALAGADGTANEREAGRIPRLRQNLARLRLDVNVIEADATLWRPPALLCHAAPRWAAGLCRVLAATDGRPPADAGRPGAAEAAPGCDPPGGAARPGDRHHRARLAAHHTCHVARTGRHGRLLRRAGDQDLTLAPIRRLCRFESRR